MVTFIRSRCENVANRSKIVFLLPFKHRNLKRTGLKLLAVSYLFFAFKRIRRVPEKLAKKNRPFLRRAALQRKTASFERPNLLSEIYFTCKFQADLATYQANQKSGRGG